MIQPILHIRSAGRGGVIAGVIAVVAIAVIFAAAIATETSLFAAFCFASLVAMAAGEVRERLEQFGSVAEARKRLDEIEREGRR